MPKVIVMKEKVVMTPKMKISDEDRVSAKRDLLEQLQASAKGMMASKMRKDHGLADIMKMDPIEIEGKVDGSEEDDKDLSKLPDDEVDHFPEVDISPDRKSEPDDRPLMSSSEDDDEESLLREILRKLDRSSKEV